MSQEPHRSIVVANPGALQRTARPPTPSPTTPRLGKRSAQTHRAGGVRDQSRMAATRHEARGVVREPDGGMPGRPSHPGYPEWNFLCSEYGIYAEYSV